MKKLIMSIVVILLILCSKRMINFKDIPEKEITIKAPTLIIIRDKDVITPEHAIEIHRLITNSQLAIIPGGQGEYIGEITTLKKITTKQIL